MRLRPPTHQPSPELVEVLETTSSAGGLLLEVVLRIVVGRGPAAVDPKRNQRHEPLGGRAARARDR
jgi:hypothetical protein